MKKIGHFLFVFIALTFYAKAQDGHLDEKPQNKNALLDQMDMDISDLKIRSLSDRLSWSADMLNSYDNYNTEGLSTAPAKRHTTYMFSRMRLHAQAHASSRLSGHFTFSGSYFYNQTLQSFDVSLDNPTADAQGYSLKIDRAFATYSLLERKLAISFGRLPTMFGPPEHYAYGTSRMGTYPLLAYSVPFEGVAVTTHVHKVFYRHDELDFRLIASPFSGGDLTGSAQIGATQSTRSPGAGSLVKNGQSLQFMADYEAKNLGKLGNLGFIFQGTYISFANDKSLEARGALDSVLSGDRNVYEITGTGKKALDGYFYVTYLEFNDIAQSGLSFYASHKYSKLKRRGTLKATIIEDHESSALGAKGTSYDIGSFIVGDRDRSGFQQLYGLAWQHSSRSLNTGFEYINTHVGAMPSSVIHLHPTDFYSEIGKGQHYYVTYQFMPDTFSTTLGYMRGKYSQRFNSFSYLADDYETQNFYLSAFVRF